MQTVVVFDCESDGCPPSVADDGSGRTGATRVERFQQIQCTCAVALVLDGALLRNASRVDEAIADARKIVCWRDMPTPGALGDCPFAALLAAFDEAVLISGFNTLSFDFPLLRKYYRSEERYRQHCLKAHDPFDDIRARTGRWVSLDTLLKSNGLATKNGMTGQDAVRLWNQVEYAECAEERRLARQRLEDYCSNDVCRTTDLITRATLTLPRYGLMPELTLPHGTFGVAAAIARALEGRAYMERARARARAPSANAQQV